MVKKLFNDMKYRYSNFHEQVVCNECYQLQYSWARNAWEHGRLGRKHGNGLYNALQKKRESMAI